MQLRGCAASARQGARIGRSVAATRLGSARSGSRLVYTEESLFIPLAAAASPGGRRGARRGRLGPAVNLESGLHLVYTWFTPRNPSQSGSRRHPEEGEGRDGDVQVEQVEEPQALLRGETAPVSRRESGLIPSASH
jgi:hypothetical protein